MSFSVAYSMKRKKKGHGGKMAEGGESDVEQLEPQPVSDEGPVSKDEADKFAAGAGFSKGGMSCDEADGDMVDRIMAKRMSKGGEVANEDMPEADFMPNEFDDLHLRDGLEFSETDANSGDELGDEGEDERRKDRVMRIMMKRSKQSNPKPA